MLLTVILLAALLFLTWALSRLSPAPDRADAVAPSVWPTISILFAILGIVSMSLAAIITPPFQVSDEIAHFFRADQVSHGRIIGLRHGTDSGGPVDTAIPKIIAPFSSLILHPENKVSSGALAQAKAVAWNGGRDFVVFNNTAFYPPFSYAVAASAIWAGKAVHASALKTFYLARLANGLFGVLLGCLALRIAGQSRLWLFTLLLLPMVVSEIGSTSQDSLAIPMAAVAAALMDRLSRDGPMPPQAFMLLCVALAGLAMGRVAYVGLALALLALPTVPLRTRLIGVAVVGACGAGWAGIAAHFTLVPFGLPGADAHAQVAHTVAHPLRLFAVARDTLLLQYDLYYRSFVGLLGWLDAPMPWSYYVLAAAVFAFAGIVFLARVPVQQPGRNEAIVLAALGVSVLLLFAALFVSWTPVGGRIVEGIQGRYFLPLAMFLPLLLRPVRTAGIDTPILGKVAAVILTAFPFLSLCATVATLVSRYYLT